MHLLASSTRPVLPETQHTRWKVIADQTSAFSSPSHERLGLQGYPSPPMSDSPSPLRRITQATEEVPPLFHSRIEAETTTQHIARESTAFPPALGSIEGAREGQFTERVSHTRAGAMAAVIGPNPMLTSVTDGLSRSHHTELPAISSNPFVGGFAQGNPLTGQPPLRAAKPARRNKAHVASACVNCKRAHLSCDVQRPCARCIAGGKQDTCYDVQHKKRGRPKLREGGISKGQGGDTGRRRAELPVTATTATSSYLLARHQNIQPHHELDTRTLRSPEQFLVQQSGLFGAGRRRSSGLRTSEQPGSPRLLPAVKPFAILDMDLVILKHNKLFQDVIGASGDLRRARLVDIVEPSGAENLQRLRSQLREDREQKEPAYLPPIIDREEPDGLPSIAESDIENLRRGHTVRTVALAFRPFNGRTQTLTVTVALARTNVFFITLVIVLEQSPRLLMHPPFLHSGASSIGSPPTTSPVMSSRTLGLLEQRRASAFTPASSSPYLTYPSLAATAPQPQSPGAQYAYMTSSKFDLGRPAMLYGSTGTISTLPPFPAVARNPPPAAEASGDAVASSELLRGEVPPGLQLPPILSPRSLPPFIENTAYFQEPATGRGVVRPREPSPEGEDEARQSKRRRVNIHEMLK